jgi:hypothetical protein
LYFWPEVIEFFEQHAARGDQVLVSNNVESHVLAYYVPKVVVHHGYTWRSALAETAEKVRRGDYHFLMLIEFPPPPRQPSSCVSALPDFNPMKEKYRLVKTICHGPDDPGVRLFERVAQ